MTGWKKSPEYTVRIKFETTPFLLIVGICFWVFFGIATSPVHYDYSMVKYLVITVNSIGIHHIEMPYWI